MVAAQLQPLGITPRRGTGSRWSTDGRRCATLAWGRRRRTVVRTPIKQPSAIGQPRLSHACARRARSISLVAPRSCELSARSHVLTTGELVRRTAGLSRGLGRLVASRRHNSTELTVPANPPPGSPQGTACWRPAGCAHHVHRHRRWSPACPSRPPRPGCTERFDLSAPHRCIHRFYC